MSVREWREARIGETRLALVDNGRVVEVKVLRWSDVGRRAQAGEIWDAKVTKLAPAMGGAFMAIGADQPGFLKLTRGARITEGANVRVEILREACRGKGPLARLCEAETPLRAMTLTDLQTSDLLDADQQEAIDSAIDAALRADAPITGGGMVRFADTPAMRVIDVDSSERRLGADRAQVFAAFAKDALAAISAQIRLRGLGGLIAIDLAGPNDPATRKKLDELARLVFAADPAAPKLAPVNGFGVLMLSRAQQARPLLEAFRDPSGRDLPEAIALAGLQMLRARGLRRGGRLVLVAPRAAYDWLQADVIGWRAALLAQIGPIFSFRADLADQLSNCEILEV